MTKRNRHKQYIFEREEPGFSSSLLWWVATGAMTMGGAYILYVVALVSQGGA